MRSSSPPPVFCWAFCAESPDWCWHWCCTAFSMRIVAAELDYLLYEPFKEFITMAFLLIGNIPLLYFLNKDWYDVLVNTGFGKGILAVCLLVLLISFAAVIRLTKPVEYKR